MGPASAGEGRTALSEGRRRRRRTSYTPSSCMPPSSPAAVGDAVPAATEAELPITQGGAAAPATCGAAQQNPPSLRPLPSAMAMAFQAAATPICRSARGGRRHVFGLMASQDGQVAHLVFGPLTAVKFPAEARCLLPCIALLSAPPDAPIPNGRLGAGGETLADGDQLLSPPPLHPLPPSAAAAVPGGVDLVAAEEPLLPLPGTRGALARRGRCSNSS